MIKRLFLATTALCLFAVTANAAEITGFRSAHFGADEKAVTAAAAADLNVKPADIQRVSDEATKTTVLSVKLKSFPPLNLPATVNYVLGYKCQCLTQALVMWAVPATATPTERADMMGGVNALVTHFATEGWDKDETVANRVTGEVKEGSENVVVFFRGQHKGPGGAVTLAGGPVKMTKNPKATTKEDALAANVDGLKEVSLSYEKDPANPDVFHVDVTGF